MSGIKSDLDSSEALPVTPGQITAEWCSKILERPIKEVTILNEIHGTASKIIIELNNDDEASHDAKPRRLCIKGGFDPQLLALHPGLNTAYRREAEFYSHIAPSADLRLPTTLYCGTDTVSGQGVVVMTDLSAERCTFGNTLETWPVERVRAGVEQLAALHARTWGAGASAFPWLSGDGALGDDPLRGMVLSLMSPAAWAVRFADGERPPLPDHLADRERLVAAFSTMWRAANPKYMCVVHGDPHAGNTFVTAEGEPGFIDWQGLHVDSAFHDVSYFVIGALSIADRRNHEAGLFDHYLDTLAKAGGPELERADVWDEYRKHAFHGIAWAVSAPQMQPKENVFVMTERHTAAVLDHQSLELLESLPEYKRE